MMTRKDYVSTANILKEYANLIDQFTFEDLVNDFADMFFADNNKFSPTKFEAACYELVDVGIE
jgi:hypothetical protein